MAALQLDNAAGLVHLDSGREEQQEDPPGEGLSVEPAMEEDQRSFAVARSFEARTVGAGEAEAEVEVSFDQLPEGPEGVAWPVLGIQFAEG